MCPGVWTTRSAARDVEHVAVGVRLHALDRERRPAGAAQDVEGDLQQRGAPGVGEEVLRAGVAALEPRLVERRVVVGVDEHAGAGCLERARDAGVVGVGVREYHRLDVGGREADRREVGLERAGEAAQARRRPPSAARRPRRRYQLTMSEPMPPHAVGDLLHAAQSAPWPGSGAAVRGTLTGMTGPGTLIADRYRVVRHLGSGAMASVHLADDELLGRQVAIKPVHADPKSELRPPRACARRGWARRSRTRTS